MKQALVTTAMMLLGGCSMRPDGLNWLPPEAHGSQPDLPVAGGGTADRLLIVRDGRTVASVPTEPGRGGVVYLPPK
ncbi:hypothetical protein G432_12370 [Sphingomonas sp. MM-1]|uniref:hypothetical protein n=1 Tax=Sphingomonas sp. MM-1 TaxID=745310 RepID=UPI0002C130E9|nr:hypothetical protein [Sphingomonas sp. MM-1]AGH50195.1 hypothetical protein G432_12370 [Sphingomonas sp. MM-1]